MKRGQRQKRFGWIGAAMVAATTLTTALPSRAPAAATPWQQYQGGAQHQGAWSGAINPAGVKLLWHGASGFQSSSEVAVSANGNRLFAFDDRSTSDPNRVAAFNASTGARVWSTTLAGDPNDSWASPVYHDGYVYLGSGGTLYKLDAQTGSTAPADGGWTADTDGAIVNAPVTIANDRAYISDTNFTGGGNQYAFNTADGSLAWKVAGGATNGASGVAYDPDRNLVYQTASHSDGGNTSRTALTAYNADTGDSTWTAPWSVQNYPSGVAVTQVGDRLYLQDYAFSGDGTLYVADAANDGELLWTAPTPASGDASVAVDDAGNVYTFGQYAGTGKTRAYDKNGNVLWTFDLAGGWQGSPAWADGIVFTGDQTADHLYLLNDQDGSVVRTLAGSGPVSFAKDRFFTIGTDGSIYAYSTVPEPTSLALLGVGGGLMLIRRRRSRTCS